ncbi:sulfatase [candidate division KSB1 bacterium]|nr:sulfatase [candidate division KSB1 bacterium]
MPRPTRREFIRKAAFGAAGAIFSGMNFNCSRLTQTLPNIVIIFVDDMGYGDMTRTGHPTIRTPNLDRMASEGVMMTQFYTANPVCSPSRAALLTGRWPIRTGVVKVFFPFHNIGLPKNEITLADLLKTKNYATGCIGKWHLGHKKEYLPNSRGFDYYYGIPYSNDMDNERRGDPPIPVMRNEEIVEQPANQDLLTKNYTREAIQFIERNKDKPFFLYLAHTMPHFPLHVSDNFRDTSKRGLYGDVIEEIDWSVGQILDTLKRLGLEDNTFVVFTSDNGPWKIKKQDGGSAGLLRGYKATTWEGGMREPFIAKFPGRIPANTVTTEIGTTMDLFVTCLNLAGVAPPVDRTIDGHDMLPVLQGKEKSHTEKIFYYYNDKLNAIRVGHYKLHFRKSPGDYSWQDCDPYELYDLLTDPSEKYDLAAEKPEIVKQLSREADEFRAEIERKNENRDLIETLMKNG